MAHDSDLQDRIGLTIFDLIAAGGLLFAVILDLNAIRGVVESQDLTYLEWFPLILDVFIVLVVLTAVLRQALALPSSATVAISCPSLPTGRRSSARCWP